MSKFLTIATWLTAWSIHTVKITPVSESYWRARAFCYWYNNSASVYLREILYDWSYKWYASSSAVTWNFFRCQQYYWCTNLTTIPDEVMADTVTFIWEDFRLEQYYGCTSLTRAWVESMPNSVTTIKTEFRYSQYEWCTSLITWATEVMPSGTVDISDSFRACQYKWCTSLTSCPNEAMSPWTLNIDLFRASQYEWCTSLITPAVEYLPQWIRISVSSYNGWFRGSQYKWCTSLISSANEVFNVTQRWGIEIISFRGSQYEWCTSLVSPWSEAFSITNTSWGCRVSYFRVFQYKWCTSLSYTPSEINGNFSEYEWFREGQYQWCTALTTVSMTAWASNSSNRRASQFYNAWNTTNPMVITILWNVVDSCYQSAWLDANKVDEIRVDSTLVSSYESDPNWSAVSNKFTSI
jgi:hypothetical protein